jgi:hypothetical protein
MINFRPIDNKFCLSGGWIDVPKDAKWLKINGFRAILELQFTQIDYTDKSFYFIRDTLEDLSIEYFAVPMNDGENYNINRLFEITRNQLQEWDSKFTRNRDKILVKCGVGVSRSVAVLIDYYCYRDRLTYSEAKIKISNVDKYNYGGLPISIEETFVRFLKSKYPDISAFGEKEKWNIE